MSEQRVPTNLRAEPVMGTPPPADAPMEVSEPLKPDAGGIVVYDRETHQPTGEFIDPVERARQNEKELLPLSYGREVKGNQQPLATSGVREVATPQGVQAATPPNRPSDPSRPAMSDTDSPARGRPGTASSPFRAKPAMVIEGGFGGGSGEYFALSGDELLKVANRVIDELKERIQNDARFSIAASYPRYGVTLTLKVEAEAGDGDFEIRKVDATKEVVPIEIAELHADSVVFVVKAFRREFDPAGNVETPPDAVREEVGLITPRKQTVHGPLGAMSSDMPLNF